MHRLSNTLLILSGNDPSGAAGYIADIRTATQLNCFASGIPTALTTQTFHASYGFLPTHSKQLENQLKKLLENFLPKAIKIGMLTSPEQAKILAENLPDVPIIWDPVFGSSTGTNFFSSPQSFRETLKILAPKITLLTPNIPELEILSEIRIHSDHKLHSAAYTLQKMVTNVLVKGGHFQNKNTVTDFLFLHKEIQLFKYFRSYKEFRGTGCVLSTAIACFLAQDLSLKTACQKAREFLKVKMEQAKYINGKYVL